MTVALAERSATVEKSIDSDVASAVGDRELIAHLRAADHDHRQVHVEGSPQLRADIGERSLERLREAELHCHGRACRGHAHGGTDLRAHRLEARAQPADLVHRTGVDRPVEVATSQRSHRGVESLERTAKIDLHQHDDEEHRDEDHREQQQHRLPSKRRTGVRRCHGEREPIADRCRRDGELSGFHDATSGSGFAIAVISAGLSVVTLPVAATVRSPSIENAVLADRVRDVVGDRIDESGRHRAGDECGCVGSRDRRGRDEPCARG